MKQSSRLTRHKSERNERIGFMSIGAIWKQESIAKLSVHRANASVGVGSKSMLSIMSKRRRSIVDQAAASFLIIYQSVSGILEIDWFVLVVGSQDFKCMACKRSCHEHHPVTKKHPTNKKCTGFYSNHSCNCGGSYEIH